MLEDPRRMVRYLEANGFYKDGGKGGHQKMYNPVTKRRTVVPMHKELTKEMQRTILKQAGLWK